MKRILVIIILIFSIIGIYVGWNLFGPTIRATKNKIIFINSGDEYNDVRKHLIQENIITNTFFFDLYSHFSRHKPRFKKGRYLIKNNSSIYSLINMLKSGKQQPVRFVINKIRTREDLAGKIGLNFEIDSNEVINFINNNDSLANYNIDTNTVLTYFIPNSYLLWWNSSIKSILTRFKKQHDYFWDGERTSKAKKLGLTTTQIQIIASIVEEETNAEEDKGKIASVYLNRIKKGMKLEADPTVKFAMKDFKLKRILNSHLKFISPYNTYLNTGLPPGPICTPSSNSIDAVLNAPTTDYLYFVAKPELNGCSNFAANYQDHIKFAKQYQNALDKLNIKK